MAARSEPGTVRHPWPVVFEALVSTLPAAGFRLEAVDRERGRIELSTRWERVTVHVGAVDATSTTWVADSAQRLGFGRQRHERVFGRIAEALRIYLATYYAGA